MQHMSSQRIKMSRIGFYWWLSGIAIWVMSKHVNGQRELGDAELGCPQSTYLHGNYCYAVTPIFVTYEDAEILCETGGGLLAAVKGADTQQFLHKLRVRKFLHRYWFGLNDKKIEGEWIYADGTRMSSYSKWHRGEPNNMGKIQHCGTLWLERHLEWDDEDCARKHFYICQYDEGNCTDGLPMYGRNCFEVSKGRLSYDEAEIQCAQRGGHLAMIKTEGTFRFIKSLIYADRSWLNMTEKEIQGILRDQSTKVSWVIDTWIGARFINGDWMYSDETPVAYANWAPGEPHTSKSSEDCVKLGQLWSDVQCDLRHGFICQYPVTTNFTPLPSSTSYTLSSNEAEQVLPPKEIEPTADFSKAHPDQTSSASGIHLELIAVITMLHGVAEFSLILTASALLGMLLIVLLYTMIIWQRKHKNISRVRDDQQDLEILQYPELEDQ